MSEYKDCVISTIAAYFDAAYSVRRGERVVQKGIVPGPFDLLEDAHSTAELAAVGSINTPSDGFG